MEIKIQFYSPKPVNCFGLIKLLEVLDGVYCNRDIADILLWIFESSFAESNPEILHELSFIISTSFWLAFWTTSFLAGVFAEKKSHYKRGNGGCSNCIF